MYLCKLWETESRHCEFAFPSFLYSFRTPTTPIFRRRSPYPMENARFRSLERRAELVIALKRCGAGWTRGSVVKWGAERGVRKGID
jgi:hypothetical protein